MIVWIKEKTMDPINEILISQIVPGDNDRTIFDEQSLKELADSIKAHSLLEPIIVRYTQDCKRFEIVAGERRYRACKILELETIPAIIKAIEDEEASAITLTENIARQSLDPIDEARAYQSRIDRFGWTIEGLAKHAGTSTIHIRFRLKLLKLEPEIQKLVRGGHLQIGYAQILADAELDSNFQLLAFSNLRDNPKPTPGWFRSIVDDLKVKQSQGQLFNGPLFDGIYDTPDIQKKEIPEPPHPLTTIPPHVGKSLKQIISNQKAFWEGAADQWEALGKPFKRNDCKSAAQALLLAIS
jgi:ParB/RepB/Spo0J family partition protein